MELTTQEIDELIDKKERLMSDYRKHIMALDNLIEDKMSKINIGDCFRMIWLGPFHDDFEANYIEILKVIGLDKKKGKLN